MGTTMMNFGHDCHLISEKRSPTLFWRGVPDRHHRNLDRKAHLSIDVDTKGTDREDSYAALAVEDPAALILWASSKTTLSQRKPCNSPARRNRVSKSDLSVPGRKERSSIPEETPTEPHLSRRYCPRQLLALGEPSGV